VTKNVGYRSGVGERHPVRNLHQCAAMGDRVLGIGAGPVRHYAIARFEAADPGADLDYFTGEVDSAGE
jgi:hypothetical protein